MQKNEEFTHNVFHDYFYVHPSDVRNDTVLLRSDEYTHLVKVKRFKPGIQVITVDGEGNEYSAVFREIIYKDTAVCTIIKTRRKPNEPIANVVLIAALIKGDRFDYLVEKAVELGVNVIVPVYSERCVRMPGGHKTERWQRIALSSMKQSCRSVLPRIYEVVDFIDGLDSVNSFLSAGLLLEKENAIPLKQYLDTLTVDAVSGANKSLVIVAGPEGGFTQSEISFAQTKGFTTVSLGSRRLRSETAALTALSAVMVHLET